MDRYQFWKNFSLLTELQISGTYIYDGLKTFDQLKSFIYTDEIFSVLYQIAVGIERLEKITIILIEHDKFIDQNAFEESLISHNHMDLLVRIRNHKVVKISNRHQKFLTLLSDFYRSMRYDRFNLNPNNIYDREKKSFIKFMTEELDVNYSEEFFNVTKNDDKIKIKFGKLVGKICLELYAIVYQEAIRLHIYTTEIRYDSKAAKIFFSQSFDFINEKILVKELIIYFMNTKDKNNLLKLLKSIKPLDFDPALGNDYIDCFTNTLTCMDVLDQCDVLYSDLKNIRGRLDDLNMLGDTTWEFMDE